eukprot:394952_1
MAFFDLPAWAVISISCGFCLVVTIALISIYLYKASRPHDSYSNSWSNDDRRIPNGVSYYWLQNYVHSGLHMSKYRIPTTVILNIHPELDKWVKSGWSPHIIEAIAALETAVPGINFQCGRFWKGCTITNGVKYILTGSVDWLFYDPTAHYISFVNDENDTCCSWGTIHENYRSGPLTMKTEQNRYLEPNNTLISLNLKWPKSRMTSTLIHEIIHSLGGQHEHQRNDVSDIIFKSLSKLNETERKQYETKTNKKNHIYQTLTIYDPNSIMSYKTNRKNKAQIVATSTGTDPEYYWKYAVEAYELNETHVLTDLDRVGLNILYPPTLRSKGRERDVIQQYTGYHPKQSGNSCGFWYCGKSFVFAKNPYKQCVTGGPNCPSCRVLPNRKIDKVLFGDPTRMRWQGASGYIYCGRRIEEVEIRRWPYSDIITYRWCGPHYGDPCDECRRLLWCDAI